MGAHCVQWKAAKANIDSVLIILSYGVPVDVRVVKDAASYNGDHPASTPPGLVPEKGETCLKGAYLLLTQSPSLFCSARHQCNR